MEQSISSSKNQLSFQPERIKPEELGDAALYARNRAIEARRVANTISVQASYTLGGWSSLFKEYVEQPLSTGAMSFESQTSDKPEASRCAYRQLPTQKNPVDNRNLSQSKNTTAMPMCPSGRPDTGNAVVFGVVGGTVDVPRLGYTTELMPVNEEILALSDSVKPTEIFRMASTCAAHGCQHFDGDRCRLAMRIVEQLPSVVETLPACQIRPNCRWWLEQGKAACLRCPQVVTDNYYASGELQQVAKPQ
jgi:hypothetical protein